jgi:hypothetical protein
VFSKLISRFQDRKVPDHPLASDAGLDALLNGLPESDPGRLLFEIDGRLADMEATIHELGPTLALRALERMDQFSRSAAQYLLTRYLSPTEREYLADSVWSALESHAAHLFRSYRQFLIAGLELSTDEEKLRMARCAAKAMMAWALRKKLQHFRYRVPGAELWQDAHDLAQVLARLSLLKTIVTPYRNEAETTPLGEYLIGLYLEFVPISNLVPQQLEFVEAFLRSCGALDLSTEPHNQSTHRIDLSLGGGPQRLTGDDTGGSKLRYCSVPKLRGALMNLAKQIKSREGAPVWMGPLPASAEQIERAIGILLTHWASKPPKRGGDRVTGHGGLRVMFGFDHARRMVAAAQFARKGRSMKYEGNDLAKMIRQFEETRFGRVATPEAAASEKAPPPGAEEVASPMDILLSLEIAGAQAQMDQWILADHSATGIGAVAPAVLSRHRIGALVCARESDGIDWRLGLIRRIGRDSANRPSIGLETLAWPSICAMAKPVGEESAWARVVDGGGDGWSDAIICSLEGNQLILPSGTFVERLEVDVRSEVGRWRVRLEALLDHGADYDRIEFSRIS